MRNAEEVIVMILPEPDQLRVDDLFVVPTFNVNTSTGAWCVASSYGSDETGEVKMLRQFETRAEARLFMEAAHVINTLRDRLETLTGVISNDAWREMMKRPDPDASREAKFRERMNARVSADNALSSELLGDAIKAVLAGARRRNEVMTQAELASFKSAVKH